VSAYRYGYLVEHRCRELLKQKGAYVIRSSRSLGVADLIALFPDQNEIWLVQCKKAEAPKDLSKLHKKFQDLYILAGTYRVRPFVFIKKEGRYTFIEVKKVEETKSPTRPSEKHT